MARGPYAGTQLLRGPDPLSNIQNTTTLSWVWLNGTQSAGNRIWSHGGQVSLGFQGAGLLLQPVDEGVAWRTPGWSIPSGVWTPVVLINRAGTYELYGNGSLHASAAGSATTISGNFTLGNSNTSNNSINGYTGPAAVWNSAISATEVARLSVASPFLVSPQTLVGVWPSWGKDGAANGEPDLTGHGSLAASGNPATGDGQPPLPNLIPPF